MSEASKKAPRDSRPPARPKSKTEPISENLPKSEPASLKVSEAENKKGFRLDLWSLNVVFWNIFWVIVFLNMTFGVIEQQIPVGGINLTYNECSFGEYDGSCAETAGNRVMYFGLAIVLIFVLARGIDKRIKRGY